MRGAKLGVADAEAGRDGLGLRRIRTTPHQHFFGDDPRRILSSRILNLGSGRRGSTSGNTLRKGMSGSRSS